MRDLMTCSLCFLRLNVVNRSIMANKYTSFPRTTPIRSRDTTPPWYSRKIDRTHGPGAGTSTTAIMLGSSATHTHRTPFTPLTPYHLSCISARTHPISGSSHRHSSSPTTTSHLSNTAALQHHIPSRLFPPVSGTTLSYAVQ